MAKNINTQEVPSKQEDGGAGGVNVVDNKPEAAPETAKPENDNTNTDTSVADGNNVSGVQAEPQPEPAKIGGYTVHVASIPLDFEGSRKRWDFDKLVVGGYIVIQPDDVTKGRAAMNNFNKANSDKRLASRQATKEYAKEDYTDGAIEIWRLQ